MLITRETLANVFRNTLGTRTNDDQAIDHARKMLRLKKVHIFRHLSQRATDKLTLSLIYRSYRKGAHVVTQGERGNSLFVLASGEVRVLINGKIVRTLGTNAFFGERALLFNELRTATVEVSSRKAELWIVTKATFMTIVQGKMRQQLMNRIRLQDTTVSLKELRHVRLIGKGSTGVVRLVTHVQSGTRYALKRVHKDKAGKVMAEVQCELALLAENDHPFLMQLVKTFETTKRVYILTEVCTGGELFRAIRRIPDVLSTSQTQFYIGSLVIALEELYDRNVVYRDLKPENVMLDAQGYLKLIDFGFAKKLPEGSSRTFTMIGTPHYMAPDVLLGHGYNKEVDLWSLGVISFELVCGMLPFGQDSEDVTEVVKAVLQQNLAFPQRFRTRPFSAQEEELIEGLLCRDPEKRLGAGVNGYDDVKGAEFFSIGGDNTSTLFDKLMGRELDPPLVPDGEVYCDDAGNLDDIAAELSDTDALAP
jgi:cGMP-dependent protein kinase